MKISKEVKIGILVILAIGTFIYGFNFLKGRDLFSSQTDFYAVYKNIDGLVEANPIQINGFKIGRVKHIDFFPDTSGRVVVSFSIDNTKLKIPKNSIAKIISSDLLGSKAIEIRLGNSSDFAKEGDTLTSAIESSLTEEVNRQVKPLKDKAEKLISSIDSVMVVVQTVLNKGTRDNLIQSFESIERSIKTFEHTSKMLDTLVSSEKAKLSVIFTKVEAITANIANNNAQLTNIIRNFSSISDSLAKSKIQSTIDNANNALSNASVIMEKINNGQGSIGMLINDKKLYNELDSSSAALTSLLKDIEKYPGRYFSIFRKKDRPSKKEKKAYEQIK